jgi:hypothetical protein
MGIVGRNKFLGLAGIEESRQPIAFILAFRAAL